MRKFLVAGTMLLAICGCKQYASPIPPSRAVDGAKYQGTIPGFTVEAQDFDGKYPPASTIVTLARADSPEVIQGSWAYFEGKGWKLGGIFFFHRTCDLDGIAILADDAKTVTNLERNGCASGHLTRSYIEDARVQLEAALTAVHQPEHRK